MYNVIENPGHSISFNNMNTWKRWGLFPTSRPFVAPPEPKIKMEEVDGITGVLDYSNVLTDKIYYKRREGSWEFDFIPNERPILKWTDTATKNLSLSNPTRVTGGIRFLIRKSYPYLKKGIYKVIIDGKEYLHEMRFNSNENYWELGYEPGRLIPKIHLVFTKTGEHQYYLDYIELRDSNASSINLTLQYGDLNGYYMLDWKDVYKDLYTNIHGKVFDKIRLEDDPGWCYQGRVWVNSWQNDQQETKVTISYNLDPYKVRDDENFKDWEWNELFDNIFFYGKFTVKNEKWKTIINPLEWNRKVTVTTTAPLKVFNEATGEHTDLVKGSNVSRLNLAPGKNIVKFEGNGDAVIEYIKEVSL